MLNDGPRFNGQMHDPSMLKPIFIEVCANSHESAMAAQEGGAQRVELCAALIEGGITPSAGMIEQVRRDLEIPLHVIIRPRGGDFCYTDAEFNIMKRDILMAQTLGADGIVMGILKPNGQIDMERCAPLINLARPLSVTFHRAFDMTSDLSEALVSLIALGVDRLLTSGGRQTALEGAETIAKLVQQAGPTLSVMPGSGVKPENITALIQKTGAREFHLSGQKKIHSRMTFRNPAILMGGVPGVPEYEIGQTDPDIIRQVVQRAQILAI
jgi:copper homeostasis protein